MEQFFSFLGDHPILVGTFLLLLFLFFRNERTRAGATVGTQELVRLVNKEPNDYACNTQQTSLIGRFAHASSLLCTLKMSLS